MLYITKVEEERVLELPLVKSEEDNVCLPLVINVIAKYWHQEIPLEEAINRSNLYKNVKGNIMIEGIELAEKHGFKVYAYKGSIKDIKKRIDQGIPPIVIFPGIKDIVQHALIIQGYNDKNILTYIPDSDKFGSIPEDRFSKLWEEDDYLTILLVPDDMSMYIKDKLQFLDSNRAVFNAERARLLANYSHALQLLNNDDNNPRLYYMLGVIYNDLKDYKNAEKAYEYAIALNNRFYMAYKALANLYLTLRDYQNAERYYSKAIEINPTRFAPVYKNRAIARLELNDKEHAIEDLKLYLKYYPDAKDKSSIEAYISAKV
jgi:hypothetical protein